MATTIHDVLRYLIRNQGHANTGIERDLLLTVDAAELGYPDRESYQEVLDKEAKQKIADERAGEAGQPASGTATAEPTVAELEAQLERARALEAAKTSGAQTRQTLTGTPKPTS